MRRKLTGWSHGEFWLVAILSTILMALGASFVSARATDMRPIRLDGHTLVIPQRYFVDEYGSLSWLRRVPGLDDGAKEIPLRIDASEVAAAIPGYKPDDGHFHEDLRLRLVALTEVERRRYADPGQFLDIWDAKGSYRDRIIEADPEPGFVRVYRKIEYPNSWEIFTVSPGLVKIPQDIFSFWIGHCVTLHSTLTASGTSVDCTSYALVGNFAVHFRVGGQDIIRTNDIRKYLAGLVSQWEKE
jgi:hypothetical protein